MGEGTGTIDDGHTAWILISCALVNFMTPGLAFFYGGLVRRNHVLRVAQRPSSFSASARDAVAARRSIIIQNYVCVAASSIARSHAVAAASSRCLIRAGAWALLR